VNAGKAYARDRREGARVLARHAAGADECDRTIIHAP
jgi:hypothetical protein